MRFFCLSNPPLPAELPRAKEWGEEEPKVGTAVCVLRFFPLRSHECWNHSQNLRNAPVPLPTRYCLAALTHTLVSSRLLRICLQVWRVRLTPTPHLLHLFWLGAGRAGGAVAWSTRPISITLGIVTWAISLEEIRCSYHWEQRGKSQRTGSKNVQISTANVILPFIQANCIS